MVRTRLLGNERLVMNLLLNDYGHRMLAYTGRYSVELTKKIIDLARHGGLMVDVGANYGYFSLLWSRINKHNRVVAFEPSPRNLKWLIQNVSLNELGSQIKICEQALGRQKGRIQFDLGPINETGWGGISMNKNLESAVSVESTTLDDICSGYPQIDLLKIDTEGADMWVLQGAKNFLRDQKIKNILFEVNKPRMQIFEIPEHEPFDFLKQMGYKLSEVGHGKPYLTNWYATCE